MLTSIRGLTAATLFATTAAVAAPAMAAEGNAETATAEILNVSVTDVAVEEAEGVILAPEAATINLSRAAMPVTAGTESLAEGESAFTLSGNVALVSDYRFRGVSFSDGDIALQGGIDLAHSSGFYVGTWGSTISGGSDFGELELDIYGGWSGDISDGISVDVGLLYYIYPTGDTPGAETDYFEPYASISGDLGPVSATLGVAYAWDQASLGDEDNLYIYTDLSTAIPGTPLSVSAHLGWTDGVFATDVDSLLNQTSSFDWGLGVSYAVTDSLSLGLNYVDTQGPAVEDFTDAGFFFTIGYSM